MQALKVSALEEIHAAIENFNPFPHGAATVRKQDIWNKGFPDVESFNSHASDAVFQAVKQVRGTRQPRDKVFSLVITAGRGVGKSHIISRIRHRLQANSEALFVYAGVGKYDLNRVNSAFLQTLVESLDREGSQKVTQWQELAAFIANQVWKLMNPNAEIQSASKLIETYNTGDSSSTNWVDSLAAKFCRTKQVDPDIVRAILWTLSDNFASYAVKWLSGQPISDAKATAMEMPNFSSEDGLQESTAFEFISKILSLIGEYKPIVVCFDELDLNPDVSGNGLRRPQAIASLIKPLVDEIELSAKSKGIVILTVMQPDTWTGQIKKMPGGVLDRVSKLGDAINLNFMDGDSIIKLVSLWLNEFYDEQDLVPPTSLYPFDAQELETLEGSSTRKILEWCFNNFKVPDVLRGDPPSPPSLVKAAFEKELAGVEVSLATLLEDKNEIARALRLCFSSAVGQIVEGVTVERIEDIEPRKDNNNYIDFKIVGKEGDKSIKIGVAVIQQSSGSGVLAGLKRLVDYKKYKLSRGCLVRSKEISRTANQAKQYLNKLLSPSLNGEWVKLTGDDIKPLLAVAAIFYAREDYELSENEIFEFITQTNLAINNHLICEILSNPSGQVPVGLSEDE